MIRLQRSLWRAATLVIFALIGVLFTASPAHSTPELTKATGTVAMPNGPVMLVPHRTETATMAEDLACPTLNATAHFIYMSGEIEGFVYTDWVDCGAYVRLQYANVSLDTNKIFRLYPNSGAGQPIYIKYYAGNVQFQQVQGQAAWWDGDSWWLGNRLGYKPVKSCTQFRVDVILGTDFTFNECKTFVVGAAESAA